MALWVRARRWTGGKAVSVVAVGWTLRRDSGTVTAAIFIVLAVCPRGTLETQALDASSCADTALGAASGDPGLVFWDERTVSIFAATTISEQALVVTQHVARLTDAAFLARGGDFGTGSLTEAIRVQAGRQTGGKAVGE